MDRHKFVVALLMKENRATVAELAGATGASEMTIRRDLEVLESRGALRRVRGGAVSNLPGGVEPPTRSAPCRAHRPRSASRPR